MLSRILNIILLLLLAAFLLGACGRGPGYHLPGFGHAPHQGQGWFQDGTAYGPGGCRRWLFSQPSQRTPG